MLTQDERQLLDACLRAAEERVPNFKVRPSQRALIEAIAETMASCVDDGDQQRDGSHVLVGEGPTGIGKSYAIVLGALPIAMMRKKKLVISSSTTALQDQLCRKDLPALRAALPVPFTFSVAKGRGRYACAAKLFDRAAKARQGALSLDGDDERPGREGWREVLEAMTDQLIAGDWNGDRDTLASPVENDLWQSLTTDRMGCAGTKCSEFHRCPFYRAREAMKDAAVVAVNHDLALAGLAMPVGSVLPAPAEMLMVFDEAHTLGTKAMEQFASRHAVNAAGEWLEGVVEKVGDVVAALHLDADVQVAAKQYALGLEDALRRLTRAIDDSGALDERPMRRFRNGVIAEWAQEIGMQIHAHAIGLQQTLMTTRELMLDQSVRDQRLVQRLLSALGFFVVRVEEVVATWTLMLRDDSNERVPTARWIERITTGQGEGDYVICASPLSGAEKLTELLWRRASAVVCTSATLTSCGTFDLFLESTGLNRLRKTRLLSIESPFDYERQARLVVPKMQSDPRDPKAHTNEVCRMLPALVRTPGTLVLFASEKMMREVLLRMPDDLRLDILCQGHDSKANIIDRHKRAIDAGRRSVIFGLAPTFGEGVDLAGAYLTHVVICKLNFTVPTDPLEEARREWVESAGRSAFMEICVPEAGVKLAQSVGRLLRTDKDFGTITVLDRRLATSRWGQALLKGLPPMPREIFGRVVRPEQRGGLNRSTRPVV